MKSRVRFHRRDRGQSSVLAALLCGVLILIIALTTNLGKVVTEKMAMQNAVDLATFSGAATQAGYLNRMRLVNEQIWDAVHSVRSDFEKSQPSSFDPFFHSPTNDGTPTCEIAEFNPNGEEAPAAEAEVQAVQNVIDNALTSAFKALNRAGYTASKFAALDAVEKNYPGTAAFLHFYHPAAQSGGMLDFDIAEVDVSYIGWCVDDFGAEIPAEFVKRDTMQAWKWKTDRGDVLFAAGIVDAHPQDPWLDVPSLYFTTDDCNGEGSIDHTGRCPLNVFAAAIPYYGKIGSRPNGAADWESEDVWNKGLPFLVDHSFELDPEEVESCGTHYCDYRTRFIGIFEDDLNYVQDGMQAENKFPGDIVDKIRH